MAIFGDFLGPAFTASRVKHLSDLHSKFALGHTMYQSMVNIQVRLLRLGEEKKKKIGRYKSQGKNIMPPPIT